MFGLSAPAPAAAPGSSPFAQAAPSPAAAPPATPDATAAERIAQLEAELAQAKARIAELEAELLRVRGSPNLTPPAPAPELVPADALLSVANFTRFAREAYVRDIDTARAAAPEQTAAGVQRLLEKWTAQMNREWKRPVKWSVQLLEIEFRSDGAFAKLAILDPTSGMTLGDPVMARLDERQAKRVEQQLSRPVPPERWVLAAVFSPQLSVNMSRSDPGVFDTPPFIGPGVEFRYGVLAESLAPAPRPQAESPVSR